MFSIIAIVTFIVSVYFMNKWFFGFQPGSNKINTDVQKFRDEAGKWKEELVPWEQDELELLSLIEQDKVSRKGFGRTVQGVIQSIYHEPMLYYHYREYPATSKNAVLFCQTSKYEFVYRIKSKATQVFVNEEHQGAIHPEGTFKDREGDVVGRVDRGGYERYPIYVGDVNVGSFILPVGDVSVRPRAFEIDEVMDVNQRLIFMIQGIHEVVFYLAGIRSKLPAKTDS